MMHGMSNLPGRGDVGNRDPVAYEKPEGDAADLHPLAGLPCRRVQLMGGIMSQVAVALETAAERIEIVDNMLDTDWPEIYRLMVDTEGLQGLLEEIRQKVGEYAKNNRK